MIIKKKTETVMVITGQDHRRIGSELTARGYPIFQKARRDGDSWTLTARKV